MASKQPSLCRKLVRKKLLSGERVFSRIELSKIMALYCFSTCLMSVKGMRILVDLPNKRMEFAKKEVKQRALEVT